jgi:UDP-2,3-diacylglucosamine hydrolase
MPDQAVKWIGERASHASRGYTSSVKTISDTEVKAKFLRHIEVAHRARPFDVLVTGHVHVAEDLTREESGQKVRAFNLGTWLKQPLVLELTQDHERLVRVDEFLRESAARA